MFDFIVCSPSLFCHCCPHCTTATSLLTAGVVGVAAVTVLMIGLPVLFVFLPVLLPAAAVVADAIVAALLNV